MLGAEESTLQRGSAVLFVTKLNAGRVGGGVVVNNPLPRGRNGLLVIGTSFLAVGPGVGGFVTGARALVFCGK